MVQTLLTDYTNTVLSSNKSPFLTYQSTHNSQRIATRLDYIFIEATLNHHIPLAHNGDSGTSRSLEWVSWGKYKKPMTPQTGTT
ncbi:17420_t:CDS:2, partial [Dentiscutata erythropus]